MNIVTPILNFGVRRAAEPALFEGERMISYGELAGAILRTAYHLTAIGIAPGDRIGLCLRDSIEHVVVLLAVGHLGAVAVPLDWRATVAETDDLIDDLEMTALLVEPDMPTSGATPVIAMDDGWQAAVVSSPLAGEARAGEGDMFVISATSGSTGRPKLTSMTHRQYYFAIAGMFELMGLNGRHRFLSNMPLYYSGGRNSCMAHLLRGDSVILYPSLFGPEDYVEAVGRHAVTVGGVVPSTIRQLLAIAGDTPLLSSLSLLFSTGAPLHAAEKRQAVQTLSPHFHERYGTAETMAVSTLRPCDFTSRSASVGQPHSLAQVEIVGDDGVRLPAGESGLLRIRAPGLGRPIGAAAEAQFVDGWYVPGEIARLDTAGYIFLEGRASDVVMRSGAKIHPAEIEAVLCDHAGVAEAAVLGVATDGPEEKLVAFVVRAVAVTAGELLAHCRVRLSAYKAPQAFYFVDSLPRNTAGKIDKRALEAKLR